MDKKLRIIICDDDKYILDIIHKKIEAITKKKKHPIEGIYLAKNAKEVFEVANSKQEKNLYFLDIDLGEDMMNGVEIAHQLKNKDSSFKIVFITSHSEKQSEVFLEGAEALGFINKNDPFMEDEIEKYILLALKRFHMNRNSETIELILGLNEKVKVSKSDIVYVCTSKAKSHEIIYHKLDGQKIYNRDNSITNVLKLLGERDFMFSDRGIIINKKYVVKVEKGEVYFTTGEKCSCSRTKKNEVIKQCMNQH